MMIRPHLGATSFLAAAIFAAPARAQDPADRARVLAVVDSALAAINRGDVVALTDLMIPEAVTARVRAEDGRYRVRTRAEERAAAPAGTVVERGFRPQVHLSGPLAVVWLPYDLYLDGQWSHCGVDTFTLIRTGGAWRIAAMAWSVEQPPACERHPDGPPRR